METLQRTANRGSVSTGYNITNSVKLEDTNTEYLQRPASGSDGNRRTMTLSMWLKRTQPGNDHIFFSQGSSMWFRFKTSDYFSLRLASGHEFEKESRLFRDTSAWYHLVVAIDTTQSTSTNRVKIYWNGVQETSFDTAQYPDQDEQLTLGQFSSVTTQLGWYTEAGYGFDGYITEVNYIDGSQKAPTDFGEFDDDTGIWIPKQYTGSYGSEGFFLNFDDSSSMGADSSGNGKNFNLNNVSAADQATDTCTNNFCTMNTNFKTSSSYVISEGQTKITCGSSTGWLSGVATFALTKGKWYYEVASVTSVYQIFGIADASDFIIPQAAGGYYVGYGSNDTTLSVGMYMINGSAYGNQDGGSGVGIAAGAVGDIFGVCLDLDNLGFYITRNGVSPSGSDPSSGSSLTGAFTWNDSIYSGFYYPAMSVFQGNGLETNFGGYTSNPIASGASDANGHGTFEYAPPSGYFAICSKNLAELG
jgi:hypothetical protein